MIALSQSDVVSSVRMLPALAPVVQELVRSLGDESCKLDHIACQIELDPAIAAKTLWMANSSFYGLSRQVQSIEQAIQVLGLNTVRTIAMTTGMIRDVSMLASHQMDLAHFWRHSMATAVCARELGEVANVPVAMAYLSGLLHDVGKLLLMLKFPDAYAAMLNHPAYVASPGVESERSLLGIDHAEVGRWMAQQWQFPVEMQEAIAWHHSFTASTASLPHVVAGANAVVHAMEKNLAPSDAKHLLGLLSWQRQSWDEVMLARLMQRVQSDMDSMAPLFSQRTL